jgi:hypothetical protein
VLVAQLEQAGLLRDGRSVMIRPVLAADEQAMLDFSRRLSRRTLAQRLLGPVPGSVASCCASSWTWTTRTISPWPRSSSTR